MKISLWGGKEWPRSVRVRDAGHGHADAAHRAHVPVFGERVLRRLLRRRLTQEQARAELN
jgi:hypothetical protein